MSMLDLIELKLKHWCVSPKINHLSFKISAASRPPPVNKCNPELCRMTKDGELATCKKQVSSKIARQVGRSGVDIASSSVLMLEVRVRTPAALLQKIPLLYPKAKWFPEEPGAPLDL